MSYDYESYNQPISPSDNFAFSEKSIRHGFIRKVYMILCAQLTVTFGFVAVFTLSEGIQRFAAQNIWLFWVAFVMSIVCVIALSCCGSLRRKAPHNYIFLFIFTLCEGFVLGCASATYSKQEILMAVGITAVVVLSLTVFAFQTKIDFTMCGGFVLVSVIVLMLFGILAMIFRSKIMTIVYSSVGALLFSFYLVFDTQMMMGGNHKHSISPEEYVFAALTLYLDIVNLFTYILSIIGATRD
ncbi:UNVERIFIED_CONTAM: hypothetical protein GTU68_014344 [Idotea baltica]|nr:hypothetical protein [Idotea baltica]